MNISGERKEKLNELYEKYADMLFRIALSQLGNSEDAMDAVHDVYLKYFDTLVSFKDIEHERAWFIRATVNRCHDIGRYKKIRSHPSLEEISDALADSDKSEAAQQLGRALSAIPEKYRIAVTLHYLEGFSVEETASILKIGVSAVKMRLSRGREMLKNYIETEDK